MEQRPLLCRSPHSNAQQPKDEQAEQAAGRTPPRTYNREQMGPVPKQQLRTSGHAGVEAQAFHAVRLCCRTSRTSRLILLLPTCRMGHGSGRLGCDAWLHSPPSPRRVDQRTKLQESYIQHSTHPPTHPAAASACRLCPAWPAAAPPWALSAARPAPAAVWAGTRWCTGVACQRCSLHMTQRGAMGLVHRCSPASRVSVFGPLGWPPPNQPTPPSCNVQAAAGAPRPLGPPRAA